MTKKAAANFDKLKEGQTAVTPEQIEAAKNWKPEDRQMTSTKYYHKWGRAPDGHKVYINGKVIDDKGNVDRPPVKTPWGDKAPKGWATVKR